MSRPGRSGLGWGFSLVELVIVLVILGIIAAIAVPRLGRASAHAVAAQVRSSLGHLQSAVDLYAAEHGGRDPATDPDGSPSTSAASFAQRLVLTTDADGGLGGLFGPYLREVPTNLANRLATVRIDGAAAGAGTHGWRYDSARRLMEPDDPAAQPKGQPADAVAAGAEAVMAADAEK